MKSRNWIGALLALQVLWPLAARATVLLKPNGEDAVPLRTKSLKANVVVDGTLATTGQEIVFQNETSRRIEADFYYTVPNGAVVTYFAYWFGKEKVVARIVEKERATAIYGYITAPPRQRDPALVELIGKNTFRARIFPVEPNADLKIEMRWVQPLGADAKNWVYTFPLQPEEDGKGKLDDLSLNVSIRNTKRALKRPDIANNYNLPVSVQSDGYTVNLAQKNYLAPRDFRISIRRPSGALDVDLAAARAGGKDGFFALSLAPNQTLRRARWNIAGVKVYDVSSKTAAVLRGGKTTVVCGRYKGAGKAQLSLAGYAGGRAVRLTRALDFGAAREPNNRAATLWAWRQLEKLGRSRGAEAIESTIEVSTRFGLPSKWTSWLAVPQAEMQRYWSENAWEDMNFYARLLAKEISAGRDDSRTAKRLRKQLERVSPLARQTVQSALQQHLEERMSQLAYSYVSQKYEARPNSSRLRQSERELERLARASGVRARDYIRQIESYQVDPLLRQTAQEIVSKRYEADQSPATLRAKRLKIEKLARRSGQNAEAYLRAAELERAQKKVAEMGSELAREIVDGREDGTRAKQLQEAISAAEKRNKAQLGWEYQWQKRWAYSARAHETASQLAAEKAKANADATRLAQLQDDLDRLAPQAGNTPEAFEKWEESQIKNGGKPTKAKEYFMRRGDPLISIDAPRDAQQVVALMPGGEIKKLVWNDLAKKWEARFDIPGYADEGDYTITVVIVDKSGTRRQMTLRFHVDLTAPRGQGRVDLVRPDALQSTLTPSKLRLELDGSEDTTRIFALMPWNQKIELKPSTLAKHRFFALVEVPEKYRQGLNGAVTYILTDKAHNRTQITVDVSK